MKAVICREFGGPDGLALEDVEPPAPAADEVRISVHAASVNYIDLLIARGLYQIRPQLPYVVGAEAAGQVIELGEGVSDLRPGDRVATFHLTGAFAEEMVAKGYRTVKLPETVDFETGAAILHNYTTAAYALGERGRLTAGETLLVLGAAGGVGLAAVDYGRHLGATVICCVGADEKMSVVREYGAAEVINYETEGIRDRVRVLTEDRGVDVVFDPLGGDAFDQALRCVAWEGRMLVIGFVAGRIPDIPANLPLLKSFSVVGVNTGAWPDVQPDDFRRLAGSLMELVGNRQLTPRIADILPLDRFHDAVSALADRRAVGRMILRVR